MGCERPGFDIGPEDREQPQCDDSHVDRLVMHSLLADYRKLREAARCVQHWHDSNNGGMIVSGEHVRKLWKTLDETQEA